MYLIFNLWVENQFMKMAWGQEKVLYPDFKLMKAKLKLKKTINQK